MVIIPLIVTHVVKQISWSGNGVGTDLFHCTAIKKTITSAFKNRFPFYWAFCSVV